ncbi:MAG TPA: DUF1080 domain-containing protein [Bacteroidales bacterium]|nr:DUF1080 domain-containing protein [Bacteroidales bacterium]
MEKKKLIRPVLIVAVLFMITSFRPAGDGWTNLLDKDLSQWNMYQSYKLTNAYNGEQPKDKEGNPVEPIGYNKNLYNVFTVSEEDGDPVLHITGETYGCVFTKKDFENYHLTLKVRWGDRKWEPRLDKLKDSGLLYNSTGECGVDYWRSWMLSQEFQIMQGHMGDHWGIANSAIDVRTFLPEGTMNAVASVKEPFLPIGPGTGRDALCLRSADYESPEGEWTTLELICFGDKSVRIVNGHVVMVLRNSRYVAGGKEYPLIKGKIQLQSEASEVYYKDIRIRSIDRIPDEYASYFD